MKPIYSSICGSSRRASKGGLFGLVLISIALSSCLPTSENGVDSPQGSEVETSPYLGTWEVVQLLNMTDVAQSTLTVSNGSGGSVQAVVQDATGSVTYDCFLTQIDQDVVMSERDTSAAGEIWTIYKIDLQQSGQELRVYGMDEDKIMNDIDLEVLDGEYEILEEANIIRIQETSQGLRTYLENQSGVFESDPLMVFGKSQ